MAEKNPPKFIALAATNHGTVMALRDDGKLFERTRDSNHFGRGEAYVWKEIALPTE